MRFSVSLTLAIVTASLMVGGCSQAAAPTATPAKAAEATKAAASATAPAASPTQQPSAAAQPATAPAKKVDFPASGKTITMIVPSAAGGGTDVTARLLAPKLEKDLGVPVQIVDKPGAAQQVGMTDVALAKPDGYTFGWAVLPTVSGIYLDPERKAAFGRKGLQAVAQVSNTPFSLSVNADSPYKTMKDLLDFAKANPEKIKGGTSGPLSTPHIANMLVQKAAGAKFAVVHFDGGGPELTALLGGHIDVSFNSVGEVSPQAKNGGVRVLGILDKSENKTLPGVKTAEAQGYPVNVSVSVGVCAPANTPKEIVDLMSKSIQKALQSDDVVSNMDTRGENAQFMAPDQYNSYWDSVDEQVKPLIDLAKQDAK
jgi:tripartite-type tricarboxylate transporter receptor subunit TctC